MDHFDIVHDDRHYAWCLRQDQHTLKCFGKKADAVYAARDCAHRSLSAQVTLHSEDGSIEAVWNYGSGAVGM